MDLVAARRTLEDICPAYLTTEPLPILLAFPVWMECALDQSHGVTSENWGLPYSYYQGLSLPAGYHFTFWFVHHTSSVRPLRRKYLRPH